MKEKKTLGLAIAAATLFTSGALLVDANAEGKKKTGTQYVKCKGVHACGGKSACAGHGNASCAGKNNCGGKGYIKIGTGDMDYSKKLCKKLGGEPA